MSTSPTKEAMSFLALDERAKRVALVAFLHELTVASRGHEADPPEQVRDMLLVRNELAHRITGNLEAMETGSAERYPDDVLLKFIENAQSEGGGEGTRAAWQRALQRAGASRLRSVGTGNGDVPKRRRASRSVG
jgi:hypothetical protein